MVQPCAINTLQWAGPSPGHGPAVLDATVCNAQLSTAQLPGIAANPSPVRVVVLWNCDTLSCANNGISFMSDI